MHSGEHEPTVNDRSDQPELVERLYFERDTTGSTLDYVNGLLIYYNSLEEHRPNMLQLERHARMIVDPKGRERGVSQAADGFYWGEVLGYSACETVFGEDWQTISWKCLNRTIHTQYEQVWLGSDEPDELRMDSAGLTVQGELEEIEKNFHPQVSAMIRAMARELHEDPAVQDYIVLGFTHVLSSAYEDGDLLDEEDDEAELIRNEANDILYHSGILPLEQEPGYVGAEFTHRAMLDIVYETCAELDIQEKPTDEEVYLAQLQTLTSAVNTKLIEHPGVHMGEEYRFSGSVLAVVYSFENPNDVKTFLVNEGAVVEGTMQPVYVLEGPAETVVTILESAANPDPKDLEKHINPYCPLIEVGAAVIQEPDGTVHQVPEYERLFVVLSNEQMHLERFVIQ